MRLCFLLVPVAVCLPLTATGPQPMPLVFEPNLGQWAASIQYVGRAGDTVVMLTDREAIFVLSKPAPHQARPGISPSEPASERSEVRMKLGKSSGFVPFDRQPGLSHYYIGNNPANWRRNVPQYGRVEMRGVYPGIDLSFYGNQGRIEYDFIVHPGADPSRVEMAYEGADSLGVNARGDLVLHTRLGDLVQHKPFVYQLRDGRKQEVAAAYHVSGSTARVNLESYDRDRDLLVDPVLTYSARFGNANPFGLGAPIAVDSKGCLYIAGETPAIPNPASKSSYQATNTGFDVAIQKFNNNFTQLLSAVYVGGSAEDRPTSIAVDKTGAAVVAGFSKSTDFYTTPGAYQSTRKGFQDAFILRVNADGTGLVYSTYFGGGDSLRSNVGYGVSLDAFGKAYLTGATNSPSFPTTAGAYKTSYTPAVSGSSQDAFLAQFDSTGALGFSTLLGNTGDDVGITCRPFGETGVFVAGWTSGPFPDVHGTLQPTTGAGVALSDKYDVFIVRVSVNGTILSLSRLLGGSKQDVPSALAVDLYGSVWVAGQTQSNSSPGNIPFPSTAGAIQPSFTVSNGAYITKLSSDLSTIQYSTFFGHAVGGAAVSSLAVDAAGNAWFTGYSFYAIPTTPDAVQPQSANPAFNRDAFFAGIKNDGSKLLHATYLSSSGADYGGSLALDASGFAYVTGYTDSAATDFPLTPGLLGNPTGGFFLQIRTRERAGLDHLHRQRRAGHGCIGAAQFVQPRPIGRRRLHSAGALAAGISRGRRQHPRQRLGQRACRDRLHALRGRREVHRQCRICGGSANGLVFAVQSIPLNRRTFHAQTHHPIDTAVSCFASRGGNTDADH
ncbi:MAG: SBBP repeat-containing protein [Acidobacteria bacterium]|nr:SBBP repeat-containing protein [Acidobacteriota bacterium]